MHENLLIHGYRPRIDISIDFMFPLPLHRTLPVYVNVGKVENETEREHADDESQKDKEHRRLTKGQTLQRKPSENLK